jgi:hypothetical protein
MYRRSLDKYSNHVRQLNTSISTPVSITTFVDLNNWFVLNAVLAALRHMHGRPAAGTYTPAHWRCMWCATATAIVNFKLQRPDCWRFLVASLAS